MGFLKRLFGGRSDGEDKDGLYYYIRSNTSGEVIRLRLHRYNDLSPADDYESYHVHKTIVGERGFDRIEADFFFDKRRNLVNVELQGGTLVEREDYDAYLAQRQTPTESGS
ncbi:MAG: hypothetical protein GXY36_02415 [Chloroflexi bacterium]|nr:hypothetical protein [Chloroflexota bacterium]